MAKIYAVAVGRKTGLFTDWEEVKGYVTGFAGARYKSFGNSDDAQKYIDVGGIEEKVKPAISRIQDLSKTCVIYADASRVPTNDSFRVCCVIETSQGTLHTRVWSWQADYEIGSDLDLQCYAYTHAISVAYKQGYREFQIIFKNDCIQGWADTWKARSSCAQFYKEVIRLMRSRYGCTVTFQKYAGSESLHQKLQHEVKLMLQEDDKSEHYVQFGFKSEM